MTRLTFRIIDLVQGTSNNESRWRCCIRCSKHAAHIEPPTDNSCQDCSLPQLLKRRTALHYITAQVRAGYLAPQYVKRKDGLVGFKCKGLCKHGRNPKTIYQMTYFEGFSKPELVPLDDE